MSLIECIEFLMSINIIMSEQVLHLLYTTMSEEHQGAGITYKDIQLIIIQNLKDNLKEEKMNEAFRLITNDQGFIDSEEFKELLMEHGMTEKLAEDLI